MCSTFAFMEACGSKPVPLTTVTMDSLLCSSREDSTIASSSCHSLLPYISEWLPGSMFTFKVVCMRTNTSGFFGSGAGLFLGYRTRLRPEPGFGDARKSTSSSSPVSTSSTSYSGALSLALASSLSSSSTLFCLLLADGQWSFSSPAGFFIFCLRFGGLLFYINDYKSTENHSYLK